MKQFIYFAQAGDAVKIGITNDLIHRLSELQCGSAIKIVYVHTMLSNRRKEKQLHKHFHNHRLRGEWYKAQPVLEYLAAGFTINKFTSEQEMDSAWKIKMEHEVERLITEHRNRFK